MSTVAAPPPTRASSLGVVDPHGLVLDALRGSRTRRVTGLVSLGVVLGAVVLASLALGARDIAPVDVLHALFRDPAADAYDSAVVLTERVPRTLLGLLVGAALGAAGVVMQGVTRNPLVDGGTLGVEMGAACAVVVGVVVLGAAGGGIVAFWSALVGAALTTAAVWTLSRLSTNASTAIALVVAGAAVTALLAAVVNLVVVRDQAVEAHYRSWAVGQLAGQGDMLPVLWPFVVAGLLAALLLGGPLNAVALGDATAAGLGLDVRRATLVCAGVAVLLCAAATAAVGPVGFVGLVGAHLARLAVGADHRWVLPVGMLCGAVMLLAADVAGRLGPGHGEIPVGVMTALVGTPVFVALARSRRLVEL